MLLLAPRLSSRTLNSSVLKHLSKLQALSPPPPSPAFPQASAASSPAHRAQVDEEPAIRANTTICLGNISRHLTEATCKRVLLNAFARALRDTFPPARSAGLLALKATIGHYDAAEAALRVLPALAPLLVDPEAEASLAPVEPG